MAPIQDDAHGWIDHVRGVAGNIAMGKAAWTNSIQPWQQRHGQRGEWQAFELADVMELGIAREVTTSFITPPPLDAPTGRCLVEQSSNCCEFVLSSEAGEPLLVARTRPESSHIEIYIPAGVAAVGPAFTMTAEGKKRDKWTLTSNRCECCEYLPLARAGCSTACRRRELMHIQHTKEDMGPGSGMTMEVAVPELRPDGTPAVWCARSSSPCNSVRLESRRPRWSPRLKSLTLDFFGRCSKASPKNFQLQLLGADQTCASQETVQLLFGKIQDNLFVLDYRQPLGMVQAFAAALSTKDWK